MKLFDLHCDTVFECEKRGCRLNDNESLHISLKKAEKYEKYVQVLAFWSDSKLTDDEAYRHFWRMLEYFRTEKLPDSFEYYLAVEGGSLLGRDLSRLDELDKAGITLFTPVWSGINAVGGAHGTDAGLTKFGEEVISRCFELGITPDISHASDRTAQSILEIAADIGRPAVATHSCCRWIYSHPRNITYELARRTAETGGVIGCNIYPKFLGGSDPSLIVKHISALVNASGEDAVCLGCDLDGIDVTPDGINSVAELDKIADLLCKNKYPEPLVDKIFYSNARNFAKQWLKGK